MVLASASSIRAPRVHRAFERRGPALPDGCRSVVLIAIVRRFNDGLAYPLAGSSMRETMMGPRECR